MVDQLINLLIKYHLHLSSQSNNQYQLSQNEKYEEWKNIISSSSHLPPSDLSILLKTKEIFFENYHFENHHQQNNEIKEENEDGWLRCGNLQNIFDFLEKEKDKEEKEDHDYLKFLVSDISPIELLKFHLHQYSSSFENNKNDQQNQPSHLSQNNNNQPSPTSQFKKGEGYTCGLWKLFHILLLSLSHPTSITTSSSSFSSQNSYFNILLHLKTKTIKMIKINHHLISLKITINQHLNLKKEKGTLVDCGNYFIFYCCHYLIQHHHHLLLLFHLLFHLKILISIIINK